jgi:DNA-binding FadR family transcriptional regulator
MTSRAQDVTPPWEQGGSIAHPVTRAVRQLADQLFARILTEGYPLGTRLPPERQLAEEFSVSRNTVRQALDLLETHEVIARRAGSGSFVVYQGSQAGKAPAATGGESSFTTNLQEIAEITSPLELNVVRSIIEPELIRLAVINMSARDIAKLRDILSELEKVTTSAEDFSRWDLEFHLQLARGTHNPLLIAVSELIAHVRQHAHWARTKEKTLSPNRIRDYQRKHRAIYEAIEARDIESASEYMKLHMTEVQRDLMRDH